MNKKRPGWDILKELIDESGWDRFALNVPTRSGLLFGNEILLQWEAFKWGQFYNRKRIESSKGFFCLPFIILNYKVEQLPSTSHA